MHHQIQTLIPGHKKEVQMSDMVSMQRRMNIDKTTVWFGFRWVYISFKKVRRFGATEEET